jgi:hypothetical protein
MRKVGKLSSEIGFIEFDARNTGQNYGYASAAGVIRTINKKMAELGLAMTCDSEMLHFSVQKDPAKDRLVSYAVVKETIRIFDVETGEFVASSGTGSGVDYGDKAQYKASTGGFKYALAHLLCLGWGAEDPEADASADSIGKADKTAAKPDLLAQIKAAGTTEELNALRAGVAKLDDGPKKEKAIEAFRKHPAYAPPSK